MNTRIITLAIASVVAVGAAAVALYVRKTNKQEVSQEQNEVLAAAEQFHNAVAAHAEHRTSVLALLDRHNKLSNDYMEQLDINLLHVPDMLELLQSTKAEIAQYEQSGDDSIHESVMDSLMGGRNMLKRAIEQYYTANPV